MHSSPQQSRLEQVSGANGVPEAALSQPWKKYWPPQSKVAVGEKHGVAKGGLLLHDGSSGVAAEYNRDVHE